MLYSFFVPTGKIDDTDTDHSDSKEIASRPLEKVAQKPLLTDVQFDSLMKMDALALMPLIPKYEEKFIIKPDWLSQLKAKK